jgi:hypothetical protein
MEMADKAWDAIVLYIEEAAIESCGVRQYKSNLNDVFWDENLLQLRDQLQQKTDNNEITTDSARQFREAARERRYHLFHEESEKLGNPQFDGSFLRMVKGRNKRMNRGVTMLDVNQINQYAKHFESTFGGDPMGLNDFKSELILIETDPKNFEMRDFAPIETPLTDIEHTIAALAQGKAAGCDGLMGEFFVQGKQFIAPILRIFFQILSGLKVVPTEWKQALIVPIYKNKGSAKEIANYRPIALTCVCRRIYERLSQARLEQYFNKLNDFQGGFRRNRSTHQQVMFLNELMNQQPNAINVLLDLKATYDLVDREVLWTDLATYYEIEKDEIMILRSLFDFNKSFSII